MQDKKKLGSSILSNKSSLCRIGTYHTNNAVTDKVYFIMLFKLIFIKTIFEILQFFFQKL